MNGRRHSSVAWGCIETGLAAAVLDVDLEVVLEVLPDAGQVLDDLDPEPRRMVAVPDPGQLEHLRRVDRATGEDHLARRDAVMPAAGPVLDPGRAPAVEGDLGDQGRGPDLEVPAPAGPA